MFRPPEPYDTADPPGKRARDMCLALLGGQLESRRPGPASPLG